LTSAGKAVSCRKDISVPAVVALSQTKRPQVPIFQLPQEIVFPDPDFAEPDGLLAVGGDLSPRRLLAAYRQGIFPWYTDNEPLLWWSPAPRLVLLPEEFHLPRRLARTIRQAKFSLSADRDFPGVIELCKETRLGSGVETWITREMEQAYIRLHEMGYAHSIESRIGETLVGGLYGVCLDRVFFGESMFTLVRDASKVALAALVDECRKRNIALIDCQMTTAHLLRFGAREISRDQFRNELERLIRRVAPQEKWRLEDDGQEETAATGACRERTKRPNESG